MIRFAEVGEGNLNFLEIMESGLETGAKYLIIEQDDTYGADPYDCLALSRQNLINMGYHGLDVVMYLDARQEEVAKIYEKALGGVCLTLDELRKYKGYLLSFLGKEYHKRGWVIQYHIGPMRNNSTRMFETLGAVHVCMGGIFLGEEFQKRKMEISQLFLYFDIIWYI